jgi:hypothetical protein
VTDVGVDVTGLVVEVGAAVDSAAKGVAANEVVVADLVAEIGRLASPVLAATARGELTWDSADVTMADVSVGTALLIVAVGIAVV